MSNISKQLVRDPKESVIYSDIQSEEELEDETQELSKAVSNIILCSQRTSTQEPLPSTSKTTDCVIN